MKNKLKELDVDFIGGQQQTITKEEESAISAFIRKQKEKSGYKLSARQKQGHPPNRARL
jgi:hypothetical protein